METHRSGDNKVSGRTAKKERSTLCTPCATIDTNVLMYIFLKKVDVFSQLKEMGFRAFVIPRQVVEELERLTTALAGKERKAAIFALNIIKSMDNCQVVEVEAEGTDPALLKVAEEYGCTLITNDKGLKKRAKGKVAVGFLRELNRIEVEEV
jgi:hypothetical protein